MITTTRAWLLQAAPYSVVRPKNHLRGHITFQLSWQADVDYKHLKGISIFFDRNSARKDVALRVCLQDSPNTTHKTDAMCYYRQDKIANQNKNRQNENPYKWVNADIRSIASSKLQEVHCTAKSLQTFITTHLTIKRKLQSDENSFTRYRTGYSTTQQGCREVLSLHRILSFPTMEENTQR